MNILEIIEKKKNNLSLNKEELDFAFNGYLNKDIPDYQMSALLMAIVINGMSFEETLELTDIFIKSGEEYNLSEEMDHVVDKHSTGGVGDSTTLIIGPMCSALGLHMAKMSGRGLGLTGGTIDKIESIPGFNVNLEKEAFIKQVRDFGFALSSQSDNLTPLDKVIYALRDVTGTTESIPLIASSIMSKKIALGAEVILIDIKVGNGALIKDKEKANELSDWLIKIGEHYNRKVKTIISNMDTPLSFAVGNAIEVIEAEKILQGKKGPLRSSCIDIVGNLYSLSMSTSLDEGLAKAKEILDNGEAYEAFKKFVILQGGDLDKVTLSNKIINVKAPYPGYIKKINALGAAKLAAKLGASKMNLNDQIDYGVGLLFNVSEGSYVEENSLVMKIYVKDDYVLDPNDLSFIHIDTNL